MANPWRTLRSVVRFRPPRDRSRRAAARPRRHRSPDLRRIARRRLPRRRLRLRRRRGRGRADARRQPGGIRRRVLPARWCCADVGEVDVGLDASSGTPSRTPVRARADRLHRAWSRPRRRAGGRRRGRGRGPALPFALSTLSSSLDRGGPGRQRRPPLVPGLRAGGTGASSRRWSDAGRRCSLRGPRADRRHRRVSGRRERDVRRGVSHASRRLGLRHHHPDGALAPAAGLVVVPRAGEPHALRQRRSAAPTATRATPVTICRLHPQQFDSAAVVGRRRLAPGSLWNGPIVRQGHPDRWTTPRCAAEAGVDAVVAVEPRRATAGRRSAASYPAGRRRKCRRRRRARRGACCDGGIRRGSDVVKAVAAGADRGHGRAGGGSGAWPPPARARRRPGARSGSGPTCSGRWRCWVWRPSPSSTAR